MRSLNILVTVLPYFFRSSWAQSIAEIAIDTPDLSKLVDILVSIDVVDLLSDCSLGPFTVFAPSNAAFKDFGEGLLKTLIADTTSHLIAFHIVEGEQRTSSFTDGIELKTFEGKKIKIRVDDDEPVFRVEPAINEGVANIRLTDVQACNGVVHIIDAVLDVDGDIKPEDVDGESTPEDIDGGSNLGEFLENEILIPW